MNQKEINNKEKIKLKNTFFNENLNKYKKKLKTSENKELFLKEFGDKIFSYRQDLFKIIFKLEKENNFLKSKILKLNFKIKQIKKILDVEVTKEEEKKQLINQKLEKNLKNYKSSIKDVEKSILGIYKIKESKKQIKKIDELIKKRNQINIEESNKIIDLKTLKINDIKKKRNEIKSDLNKFYSLHYGFDKLLEKPNFIIDEENAFSIKNLNVFYGEKQSLFDINLNIPKNKVLAIVGPSGCGKSTFLRTLNRINDEILNFNYNGDLILDGEFNITNLKSIKNDYDKLEITELRTKVGMIFQQPNPFPTTIFKNVSFGPRINGKKNKYYLYNLVKKSLKDSALWEEVKHNLDMISTSLSGGQQQRLCIARTIANKPEILLMDEPTSALDPVSSFKIENLINKLKKNYTIIIVTHSMQQAARVSDNIAFFYKGKMLEYSKTKDFFENPKNKKAEDYIRGRFG